MALKLSTGLRNAILGDVATITATTISADEDAGSYYIKDSANGLFSAGFCAGDTITISGFTGTPANNQITTVISVATDGSQMEIEGTLVDDAAGESVTITACQKGWKDLFKYSVIRVYEGSAPSDADAAETGTLLLEITKDGGAFTAGQSTNGFEFDAIASGVLSKKSDTHKDDGITDGTAGYYRHYNNQFVTGASTSAIRMQGTVGTASAQFILSSTSIESGATVTLDSYTLTQPAS